MTVERTKAISMHFCNFTASGRKPHLWDGYASIVYTVLENIQKYWVGKQRWISRRLAIPSLGPRNQATMTAPSISARST